MGIDYGNGLTNIDQATGIRYGVIHSNEVLQSWADSSESDYGDPHCPKCGNEATDRTAPEYDDESSEQYEYLHHACGDYCCNDCLICFDGEDAYGDEPCAWNLDDGEYLASQSGSDCDIFILKSPFYTRAEFCSPCAPGACYLMNPEPGGPKAYCFGHDWFWDTEDKKAPYPVYRVSDDTLVYPAS